MTRAECIHILRNPYGHKPEEIRRAQLQACEEIEALEKAYDNMRDWAEKNGVNTVAANSYRGHDG
jgi:hypothetical protein